MGACVNKAGLKTNDMLPCKGADWFPVEGISKSLHALARSQGVDETAVRRCIGMQDAICDWLQQQTVTHNDAGWHFQEFIRNKELSIGLLDFSKGDSLPVHDHPGSTGLLLVLDGELIIENFSIECDDPKSRIVNVKRSNELSLKPGEFSVFTPNQGNIHTLVSTSKSCWVLDILISPYAEADRTWFMPLATDECKDDFFKAMTFKKSAKI